MGKIFRNFISYLIFTCKWVWLEQLITFLCEIEMLCSAARKVRVDTRKIPQGFYCYTQEGTCPYWDYSKVAKFFYGAQSSGYCHFLHEGDFNSGTLILWDQCKCCCENEEECNEEDL